MFTYFLFLLRFTVASSRYQNNYSLKRGKRQRLFEFYLFVLHIGAGHNTDVVGGHFYNDILRRCGVGDMLLQFRQLIVQPEFFGIVGADTTRASDADVLAGRITKTIFAVRHFFKLRNLVGFAKSRT